MGKNAPLQRDTHTFFSCKVKDVALKKTRSEISCALSSRSLTSLHEVVCSLARVRQSWQSKLRLVQKGGNEANGSPGVWVAPHVGIGEPGWRAQPFPSVKSKVAFNYARGGDEIVVKIHVADCEMKKPTS